MSDSDTERRRYAFGGQQMETDKDRMVERAIASLVERGKMTPEEAAVKRSELRQSQDAVVKRAALRQATDKDQMDGE